MGGRVHHSALPAEYPAFPTTSSRLLTLACLASGRGRSAAVIATATARGMDVRVCAGSMESASGTCTHVTTSLVRGLGPCEWAGWCLLGKAGLTLCLAQERNTR